MSQSTAETLLAAQLSQAGIPFEREYRFAPPRRWRADFYLADDDHFDYFPVNPVFGLLVEVEGGSFTGGHRRGRAYELDCEKASAAAIRGWRVIRATPLQVENGTALSWIRAALGLAEKAA